MDKYSVLVGLAIVTAAAAGLGYWLLPDGTLRDVTIIVAFIAAIVELPLWFLALRDN